MAINRYQGRDNHLRRLDRKYYQGHAYVHWTMATQDRRTGWLTPAFYSKFRELLTHSTSRYSIACPIFCLMPDHIHMLWIGIFERADQINAIKHFRKHLSVPLRKLGFSLQIQPYDHVLRDEERLETSFIDLADYIARNPERKKLVPVDGYREYKFTGCLIPGYPEFDLWEVDYWPRFWRVLSYLRKHDLLRGSTDPAEDAQSES